ncbi:MAG: protein kinase [Blastocatellia bacterium]|nr:protein kinase [Blastocatellia bacterium]
MNTETWKNIDALLDEYLDSPTAKRATFLDDRSPEPAIRQQLETLIANLDDGDDLIDDREFASVKDIVESESDKDLTGTRLMSYQLLKLIGTGGMGSVYLANRIDDFDKQVAIKVIAIDGSSVVDIENFRRERQILARLEHPNIARILDGGTSADGVPFIVMEYVDGVPLNVYCKDKTLGEKLRLFREVCKAVSYAHSNLIVHSDLKPKNILVANDGTVKLLDFGIAKLMQSDSDDEVKIATISDRALTPDYAAPEQFANDTITVATDVYSLGVILYEILSSQRPYSVAGRSPEDVRDLLGSLSIKPPSSIRDIDSIVQKAIAHEPRARYRTLQEFDADIANYLENRPVTARPNSLLYRAEKAIRRNKLESAIAVVIFALLVGWLGTTIWQRNYAQGLADENRRAAYSAEMILAGNEYERTNLNRVNELVQKYLPSAGETDLRGFEWYFLRSLLNPTSKITTFVHSDEVWNAEFSPDGRLLTTVSNDNVIRTWDFASRSIVSQTEPFQGAWKSAYFPDSKKMAVAASSAANALVKVYDAETSREILTLTGHSKRVRAVDVSSDGKLIASGSQDGTVRIWDAATGQELRKFEISTLTRGREILDLQFDPTGETLYVAGFELVATIDLKNWHLTEMNIKAFDELKVTLFSWAIALSPDAKLLAIGNWTGEVVVVDAKTLAIRKVIRGHRANVKSLAFSPDGRQLATASWDRTVRFFELQNYELVNELKGHFAGVHSLVYSANGDMLATAGGDFNVSLWNAAEVGRSNSVYLHSSLSVIGNGGTTAFSWSGTSGEVSRTELTDGNRRWASASTSGILSAALSTNGEVAAVGDKFGTIILYDGKTGVETRRLMVKPRSIYAMQISADGTFAIVGYDDGFVQRVDLTTGMAIYEVAAHEGVFRGLSISGDGNRFATGGNDDLVNVFDAADGRLIYSFKDNQKPLYAVTFSANAEYLAAVGADDIARVWRLKDGELVKEFTGMSAGIFAVAFSNDGDRLATGSDVGIIRLWDIKAGRQVLAFTASEKQIANLAFSADGNDLASVDSSGKAAVWRTFRREN